MWEAVFKNKILVTILSNLASVIERISTSHSFAFIRIGLIQMLKKKAIQYSKVYWLSKIDCQVIQLNFFLKNFPLFDSFASMKT